MRWWTRMKRWLGFSRPQVVNPELAEHERRLREVSEQQRRIETLLYWQMQNDILDARRRHDQHYRS